MTQLIESQIADALAYMKGIREIVTALADEPAWGGGMRLTLPAIIPLTPDYDDQVVAWLVANDFEGYDLVTEDPAKS